MIVPLKILYARINLKASLGYYRRVIGNAGAVYRKMEVILRTDGRYSYENASYGSHDSLPNRDRKPNRFHNSPILAIYFVFFEKLT